MNQCENDKARMRVKMLEFSLYNVDLQNLIERFANAIKKVEFVEGVCPWCSRADWHAEDCEREAVLALFEPSKPEMETSALSLRLN